MGKRTASARQALSLLYRKPVIDGSDLEQTLNISTPTANALIKSLIEKNILFEITGQHRGRMDSFESYLRLFLS